MRAAWLTDIHLNFPNKKTLKLFFYNIWIRKPDAIFITGDIGEADSIEKYLKRFENEFQRPIYFVLGNHDFYGSSIKAVCEKVEKLADKSKYLYYLSDRISGMIKLTDNTCIIGHDSWADGRYGNYNSSNIVLSDHYFIKELAGITKNERLKKLNDLGDEAALQIWLVLSQALKQFQNVILLTHVPPFKEASWYKGAISGDDWLPHFSCKAVGDVLLKKMKEYPDKNLTILCGHTHGRSTVQITSNILVKTGSASYKYPQIQEMITIK